MPPGVNRRVPGRRIHFLAKANVEKGCGGVHDAFLHLVVRQIGAALCESKSYCSSGDCGLGLIGIGVLIGLLLSGIMAPMISILLYGVRPLDPEVFLAVPLILLVVALLASYIPARRAARVNPIVALREG